MKKCLVMLTTLSLITLSGSALAIPAANTTSKPAFVASENKTVQAPAEKKKPIVLAFGEGGA